MHVRKGWIVGTAQTEAGQLRPAKDPTVNFADRGDVLRAVDQAEQIVRSSDGYTRFRPNTPYAEIVEEIETKLDSLWS